MDVTNFNISTWQSAALSGQTPVYLAPIGNDVKRGIHKCQYLTTERTFQVHVGLQNCMFIAQLDNNSTTFPFCDRTDK